MMRAKKCDRCGKFYDHYDGIQQFKNGERANALVLIDRDLDEKYWTRKTYDLCPACMGDSRHSFAAALFLLPKRGKCDGAIDK